MSFCGNTDKNLSRVKERHYPSLRVILVGNKDNFWHTFRAVKIINSLFYSVIEVMNSLVRIVDVENIWDVSDNIWLGDSSVYVWHYNFVSRFPQINSSFSFRSALEFSDNLELDFIFAGFECELLKFFVLKDEGFAVWGSDGGDWVRALAPLLQVVVGLVGHLCSRLGQTGAVSAAGPEPEERPRPNTISTGVKHVRLLRICKLNGRSK